MLTTLIRPDIPEAPITVWSKKPSIVDQAISGSPVDPESVWSKKPK